MITAILRHDLRLTLSNRKTWYYLAVLQLILSLIFNWLMRNFLKQQTMSNTSLYGITEEVIHPYYACFALFVLVLVPAVCTQSICAEKQHKTLINLQCAPISPLQVMLGKYFSLNVALLFACIGVSLMPLSICISGALDWGQFLVGILGVYLMLSATLAVGLALSSFMANTTRCNVLIFLALTGLVLVEWAAQYTGSYAMFLQGFGLLNPLKSFLSGSINLQFTAYYLLLIYASIFIASWRFARRWADA